MAPPIGLQLVAALTCRAHGLAAAPGLSSPARPVGRPPGTWASLSTLRRRQQRHRAMKDRRISRAEFVVAPWTHLEDIPAASSESIFVDSLSAGVSSGLRGKVFDVDCRPMLSGAEAYAEAIDDDVCSCSSVLAAHIAESCVLHLGDAIANGAASRCDIQPVSEEHESAKWPATAHIRRDSH